MEKKEDKFDIELGTISFWIENGKIDYANNKVRILVNIDNPNGSIMILKDEDNKIKFFHVYYGFGRNDLIFDVSLLSNKKKHLFTFTWDVKDKLMKGYLDSQLVSEVKMNYP